jgi:hypothetical protein
VIVAASRADTHDFKGLRDVHDGPISAREHHRNGGGARADTRKGGTRGEVDGAHRGHDGEMVITNHTRIHDGGVGPRINERQINGPVDHEHDTTVGGVEQLRRERSIEDLGHDDLSVLL